MEQVRAGNVTIGGPDLVVIAGPCVVETEELTVETAARIHRICTSLGLPFVFKCSYDKANRTALGSYRGPGLEKGLMILEKVRATLGVPVLSDIHSSAEAAAASEVLDILQIPAFLCRQTDLILAASATGKAVNVKKGQFLAPWDVKNIIEKFTSTGNTKLFITERGTSFGYNNLVVDYRALPIMRSFGYPVVFDVTHSLQLPGGQGTSSGGQRQFATPLARAAAAVGVDGLFLEVHPNPDAALCDGPNMIDPAALQDLLSTVLAVRAAVGVKEESR